MGAHGVVRAVDDLRLGRLVCGTVAAVALCAGGAALAQDREPLSREVLPLPDQPFRGVIGEVPAESRADWPRRLEAPAGAPNVLLIMTDDVGFAASSTFGGPVPTPNLDRLAQEGLRFNRFHTTAICSPSRAALLTGRNAHQVGTGELIDSLVGFPGYDGVMPQSAATVARTLQLNGYSTAMFGKHHNVPVDQQSAAGPFTQWPTGLGFDYFYGFIGGDVHQWQPKLYRGVTAVGDDERRGELLDQRLADDAITWIHNQKAAAPDKPFMIYMATGSLHAPHHAPMDWIARFSGKFDQGWDEARKETFARQLAAGIVPRGTALTPRPDRIPAWNSLSAPDRQYAARMMEVAAAELAFQDAQVGRVLDELDRMGERDNTLVIFIEGDNGASGEGTERGVTNELGELINGVRDSKAWLHSQMPVMGGPTTYQNYPLGWAWAMDTPFRWTKQFASYLGGMRNGLVISWPNRIKEGGGVRSQFSHLIDIAPTILDAAGVPAPKAVFGVPQLPLEGISLLPSFPAGAAERPRTQYFEITGGLGIYRDGWFAGSPTMRMPWEFTPPKGSDPRTNKWELYDLTNDFSQAHDLAAANPGKLAELKAAFFAEAKRNQALPLDDRFSRARVAGSVRPPRSQRLEFDYWSADTSVAQAAAPAFAGRSFTLDADLTLDDKASGVVVANGSMFGGWSFFLDQGRPTLVQAFSQKPEDQTRIAADAPLGGGQHHLRLAFKTEGAAPLTPAAVQIFDGDRMIAEGRLPKTIMTTAGIGETFDIGRDTGVPVTTYRSVDGRLEGRIARVHVKLQ